MFAAPSAVRDTVGAWRDIITLTDSQYQNLAGSLMLADRQVMTMLIGL
jgi:hypothetical protein